MLTATLIIGIGILLLEAVLWQVFRRKAVGIEFPKSADHSYFRFFSIGRMRLVAVLHTLILLAVLFFSVMFLW